MILFNKTYKNIEKSIWQLEALHKIFKCFRSCENLKHYFSSVRILADFEGTQKITSENVQSLLNEVKYFSLQKQRLIILNMRKI